MQIGCVLGFKLAISRGRLITMGALFLNGFMLPLGYSKNGPVDPAGAVRVTLQLKWTHQFQFAGYYAALEKGYYRDLGLEVVLVEATKSGDPMTELMKGNAQFGIGSSELVVHRANGQRVVALAAIFQHSPLVLVANADRGIHRVPDLLGKTVLFEPQSEEILAYLQAEGIYLENLDIDRGAHDILRLKNGEVDAMTAYLTDELFLLEGEDYPVFRPTSAGIDFYGDTLFTTEEQVGKHPGIVDAFLRASVQGWAYALDHEDEIIDLILTKYRRSKSRDHLKFEAQRTRGLVLPGTNGEIGTMSPGRWRQIAATYHRLGRIKQKDFPLNGFIYAIGPSRPVPR